MNLTIRYNIQHYNERPTDVHTIGMKNITSITVPIANGTISIPIRHDRIIHKYTTINDPYPDQPIETTKPSQK